MQHVCQRSGSKSAQNRLSPVTFQVGILKQRKHTRRRETGALERHAPTSQGDINMVDDQSKIRSDRNVLDYDFH